MSSNKLTNVSWWRIDARRGPVLCDVEDLRAGDIALSTADVTGKKFVFLFQAVTDRGVELKTLYSGEVKA